MPIFMSSMSGMALQYGGKPWHCHRIAGDEKEPFQSGAPKWKRWGTNKAVSSGQDRNVNGMGIHCSERLSDAEPVKKMWPMNWMDRFDCFFYGKTLA